MPMIDIVVPEGLFSASGEAALLGRATACLRDWQRIGAVAPAIENIGAYLHVIPKAQVTAGGKAANVVRVEVLWPAGAPGPEERAGITEGIAALVAELASDSSTRDRTWVAFREAVDGGWGVAGRPDANAALADDAPARPKVPEGVSLLRRLWWALEAAAS